MDQLPVAGAIIDTAVALGAYRQQRVTVHTSEWAWGDQGTGTMGEPCVSPLVSAAATHG
jgi:predicted nucleic acid-binding protein